MTASTARPPRLLLLATLVLAACTGGPRLAPTPDGDTRSAWMQLLARATQDVQQGRFAAADRSLLEFQQGHPAAAEAADAAYYRALFRLDPSNPASSPREAVTILDAIVATPIVNTPVSPRQADALVLRRVAVALDTRPTVVTSTTPGAAAAPAPAPRSEESHAKDEELARVKEELAKANAELERIKRRVATPKP